MQPGIQIVMARCIRARSRRWRWSGSGPRLRCVQGCPWSGRGRHSRAAGKRPSTGIRVCVGLPRILHTSTAQLYTYLYTWRCSPSPPPPPPTGSSSSVSLLPRSCTRTVERKRLLPPLLALQVLWNGQPPCSSSSSFLSSRDTRFIRLIIAFLCEYD